MKTSPWTSLMAVLFGLVDVQVSAIAQTGTPVSNSPQFDFGLSIVRILGAFILVIALFFMGIWAAKNWQRLSSKKRVLPKLRILEVKSLGQRQHLHVIGYEKKRMLVGSSPQGITFLSQLPESEDYTQSPTFSDTLNGVMNR